MKKTAGVLTVILLFMALSSCNGSFIDPGMADMAGYGINYGDSIFGGGGGSVTYTINGVTPNTSYYVGPGWYILDGQGFSMSGYHKKQGTSNAAGSVTVSYDILNELGTVLVGQEANVCYGTTEWNTIDTRSKKTYKITSAAYTLNAATDFETK